MQINDILSEVKQGTFCFLPNKKFRRKGNKLVLHFLLS